MCNNFQSQRDKVIEAALAHVPFDGWSWKAMEAGAKLLCLAFLEHFEDTQLERVKKREIASGKLTGAASAIRKSQTAGGSSSGDRLAMSGYLPSMESRNWVRSSG